MAILQALEWCSRNGVQSCTVFSDSLGVIQAYAGYETSSEEICKAWQVLKQFSLSVCISWVPGHEGNYGNELADELARTTAHRSFTPALSLSRSSFKALLKRKLLLQLVESWNAIFPKSILASVRSVKLYFRKFFAHPFYVQLATNASNLRASLQYVNRHISPYCSCTCGADLYRPMETLRHVLLSCPLFETARNRLLATIGIQPYTRYRNFIRNIFQDEDRLNALFRFFSETGLLRRSRFRELMAS